MAINDPSPDLAAIYNALHTDAGFSAADAILTQIKAATWEIGWLATDVEHLDGVGDINPISGEPIDDKARQLFPLSDEMVEHLKPYLDHEPQTNYLRGHQMNDTRERSDAAIEE
jgi:hypothetical protein